MVKQSIIIQHKSQGRLQKDVFTYVLLAGVATSLILASVMNLPLNTLSDITVD